MPMKSVSSYVPRRKQNESRILGSRSAEDYDAPKDTQLLVQDRESTPLRDGRRGWSEGGNNSAGEDRTISDMSKFVVSTSLSDSTLEWSLMEIRRDGKAAPTSLVGFGSGVSAQSGSIIGVSHTGFPPPPYTDA